MIECFVTAAISFLCTLITCMTQNNKTIAVIEEKINNLERKVEKHNNIVERTYKLEEDVKLLQNVSRETLRG